MFVVVYIIYHIQSIVVFVNLKVYTHVYLLKYQFHIYHESFHCIDVVRKSLNNVDNCWKLI